MIELAGLPAVADDHPLEGQSFAPEVNDAEWLGKGFGWALSQYPRAPDVDEDR